VSDLIDVSFATLPSKVHAEKEFVEEAIKLRERINNREGAESLWPKTEVFFSLLFFFSFDLLPFFVSF
jgi:hypothetical protein